MPEVRTQSLISHSAKLSTQPPHITLLLLDLTANKWCLAQTEEALPDFGDHVDMGTFSQILEMDEDESEREFSKPLVLNFFEQVEETFEKMDTAL
jgi:hypothetical protein